MLGTTRVYRGIKDTASLCYGSIGIARVVFRSSTRGKYSFITYGKTLDSRAGGIVNSGTDSNGG